MTGTKNDVCRRVVVTGMGLVTPVGIGVQTTWDALLQGTSGIRRITSFDASAYPCQIAGEVKDFDPLTYVDKKDVKRMDRFTQFALASATMALETAALPINPEQAHRYGCILGVGFGGMATLERNHAKPAAGRPTAYFAVLCAHADCQYGLWSCLHAFWFARP